MLDFLLDLIFPRKCLGCGKFGKFICQACQKTIRFYDPSVKHNIAGVDDTFILAHYDGIIRRAIKEIKYRGTYGICEELGNLIRTNFNNKFAFDYLVPIPLAPKRLAQRGFNQAEKLARALKLAPILDCLVRTRETKPQFDLKFSERRKNVLNAFTMNRELVPTTNYCLIDDVATTGSTIGECAKALKKAGAKKVFAICIARD